jgi:hypothetical protein
MARSNVRCTGCRALELHFPVRCPVVHRTATVRCPVCTGQALYTVRCTHIRFLKTFPRPSPGQRHSLCFSLSLWRFPLPRRRPPLTGDLPCLCLLFTPLGEQPLSSSVFLPLSSVVKRLPFPPFVQFSKSCESQ